jgi:flagellar basal-body rod modification protein FlgD
MDIQAISTLAQGANVEQGVVTTPKNQLGMDDFFKLLTTQLVSQDPLSPMQDTEFISQMASFSSLSQMELIAKNTEASRQQQEAAAVMSLLGKQVEAIGANGEPIAGRVDRVEAINGKLVPFIGYQQVPFLSITKITDVQLAENVVPS